MSLLSQSVCSRVRPVLLCLLLGLAASCAFAAEPALDAAWLRLPADARLTPEAAADPALPFQRFDAGRLTMLPREPDGVWVRLRPASGHWPTGPLVLTIPSAPYGRVELIGADGSAAAITQVNDLNPSNWHGHGRLAFPLLQPLAQGQVLLLHFAHADSVTVPIRLCLLPMNDYLSEDENWLAFASACFATMLAMAAVALLFALRLGDGTFVLYAGYILSYALVQAIQTGYAFHPLGLNFLAHAPLAWGRAATGASVMLAVLFLDRFAALRSYAPRLRRVALSAGWAVLMLSLVGMLPSLPLRHFCAQLINPLLMIGALLIPVTAGAALARGSRYAGFFLTGWLPLLLATGLGSAQVVGALSDWYWLNDAGLAAGAFEALVLSLGLSERALAVRHERDQARTLAELDALTGVLNRRAFIGRLGGLIDASARSEHQLALIFVDLDHFKTLNDCHGHAAGDRALLTVAETLSHTLRPQDVVARYGGEEFVAVLPDCSETQALRIAERVRSAVRALGLPVDEQGTPLTASIGVAGGDGSEGLKTMLARADSAMYAAKRAGRDRVVVATSPAGTVVPA